MDFTPPPPPTLNKSDLKLVCNVNIVYGNLKSENSQDYAQKPYQNCTFMNLASGTRTSKSYICEVELEVSTELVVNFTCDVL